MELCPGCFLVSACESAGSAAGAAGAAGTGLTRSSQSLRGVAATEVGETVQRALAGTAQLEGERGEGEAAEASTKASGGARVRGRRHTWVVQRVGGAVGEDCILEGGVGWGLGLQR